MILKKDNTVISIDNENHINAFISAGYVPADESPVDVSVKESPEKKKTTRPKTSAK